eukprot:gene16747-8206_t
MTQKIITISKRPPPPPAAANIMVSPEKENRSCPNVYIMKLQIWTSYDKDAGGEEERDSIRQDLRFEFLNKETLGSQFARKTQGKFKTELRLTDGLNLEVTANLLGLWVLNELTVADGAISWVFTKDKLIDKDAGNKLVEGPYSVLNTSDGDADASPISELKDELELGVRYCRVVESWETESAIGTDASCDNDGRCGVCKLEAFFVNAVTPDNTVDATANIVADVGKVITLNVVTAVLLRTSDAARFEGTLDNAADATANIVVDVTEVITLDVVTAVLLRASDAARFEGTLDNTVDATANIVADVGKVITLNVVTAVLLRTSDAARFEGTLDNAADATANIVVDVTEVITLDVVTAVLLRASDAARFEGTLDNTVDATANIVADVGKVITLNVVTAVLLRTSDAARFEGTLDNAVDATANIVVDVTEVITLDVATAVLLRTSDAVRFKGTLDNTVDATVNIVVDVTEVITLNVVTAVLLRTSDAVRYEDTLLEATLDKLLEMVDERLYSNVVLCLPIETLIEDNGILLTVVLAELPLIEMFHADVIKEV